MHANLLVKRLAPVEKGVIGPLAMRCASSKREGCAQYDNRVFSGAVSEKREKEGKHNRPHTWSFHSTLPLPSPPYEGAEPLIPVFGERQKFFGRKPLHGIRPTSPLSRPRKSCLNRENSKQLCVVVDTSGIPQPLLSIPPHPKYQGET